jgi:hypothetical protein
VKWLIAIGAWVIAIACGFAVLWRYASAPGAHSSAPRAWPDGVALARANDRATLVMFVHPRCPCSRASVAELARLVTRVRGHVRPAIVFVRPAAAPAELAGGELRTMAATVPDVAIVDDDGTLARRFGAATSGATLVYDATGRLAFSGGLTQVRGHEGQSFGQERVLAILEGRAPDRADAPVFGCPFDDGDSTAEEPAR